MTRVDLSTVRPYAEAVYAATDEYLASLTDEDLDRPMEIPGMGQANVGVVLGLLVLNHIGTETGEIACLKGLQGLRGYPG